MVYINAISYHLPDEIITNEQIVRDYLLFGGNPEDGVSTQSIYEQCSVRQRHLCAPEDTAKDLGNRAAERLFEEWNIDRSSIEYLIFVSDALEYKGPTTASIMQHNLGLTQNVGAIDILHGCTGWIYGLSLAKALIVSGQVKNVLLVTADIPHRVIHPYDAELRAIFSDGAAATLISNQLIPQGFNGSLGNFIFGTDGEGEKSLYVEKSGTRDPLSLEWLQQHQNVPSKLVGGRLKMSSPKIFLFAFRKVPKLIQQILDKHGLTKDDIDFYILHQANGTMLEFLRKRMKIPVEKFVNCIENTGNTVSSSIPIATVLTKQKNVFQPGQKIMVVGFGIGYSWGATLITL